MKTEATIRNPQLAAPKRSDGGSAIRNCGALTIIEMLVSTTLLMFIMVGLTAMFVETQRAFKAGVRQSTMTDAGHTIIDMVAADLSQVSDAQNTGITNLFWGGWTNDDTCQYQDYSKIRLSHQPTAGDFRAGSHQRPVAGHRLRRQQLVSGSRHLVSLRRFDERAAPGQLAFFPVLHQRFPIILFWRPFRPRGRRRDSS